MPKRPTSTPTPSPSRRIMNIMVTGLLCAYCSDDSNQPLFSSLRLPAATSLEQAVTSENARLFLFVRNLLYLLVSFTSVLWLAGPTGSWSQPAWYPHKRETLDRAAVRHYRGVRRNSCQSTGNPSFSKAPS